MRPSQEHVTPPTSQIERSSGPLSRLLGLLPHGRSLPPSAWCQRHRVLVAIVWMHAVALPLFGVSQGYGVVHSLLEGLPVAAAAGLAMLTASRRRLAAACVSLGLVGSSAILVHLAGGITEAHFHFFVVIVLLSLYEDWVPFLLAAGFVLLHHGLGGALDAGSIYEHPDAVVHPWRWAAIHAGFVTAAGIAALGAWRLNEQVRAEAAQAYEAARASEARFKVGFEHAPVGMALAPAEDGRPGPFMQVNRALCEITGYARDELVGRSFADITHPGDIEKTMVQLERLLSGEIARSEVEKRYVRADGSVAWALVSVSVVRDEEGQPVQFIGQVQDVTESRRLLARHGQILDSAAEGIYGLDADGRTTFVNAAAAAMTGYETYELIGRVQHDLVHHTRADGSPYPVEECPITATRADGQARHVMGEVYWRKDGTSFPVEYTVTPLGEDDERGAVVVFRDVTERLEVERLKSEFTSVVSHELRTPLTSIHGALGLLAGGAVGELPERAQRMVDIAAGNTDRLVRLINDILDIERIESGRLPMERTICLTSDLVAEAVDGLRCSAAAAGLEIAVEAEPIHVEASSDRIVQTLTNLLSNAIKFSPAGGTLRVSCARAGAEALFSVSDEGRGIPRDKLESVFERFEQVDASDSREHGGTGLGLAISRSIVEQHGGLIWVESELGRGSTFRFTIPALPVSPEVAPDAGDGPTVLVCDDDPMLLDVIGALLRAGGYRALLATSGEQAIELARSEHPDALLLDLLMPGMSGCETAAALRSDPDTRDIPIVILSVLAPGDTEHPVGPVADWLEKPVERDALCAAVARAIEPLRQPRVLVLENDPELAATVTAAFERHGLEVFHAQPGTQAVELAIALEPAVVALDVSAPDEDGLPVIDRLRDDNRLSDIVLFLYSGASFAEDEQARIPAVLERMLDAHGEEGSDVHATRAGGG